MRLTKTYLDNKYDYSRIISAAKNDSTLTVFSSYIDMKIKKHRNEIDESFNRRTLSTLTGISYEMLKKIIDGSKHTRKRDCIIAICVALELDPSETDMALELYPMHRLNPNNMRDLVIIQSLTTHESIDMLNKSLEKCSFSKLNLSGDSASNRAEGDFYYSSAESNYKEISREVYAGCFIDSKDLSGIYNPTAYGYDAFIVLQSPNGELLKLTNEFHGAIHKEISPGTYMLDTYYTSSKPCPDAELSRFFNQLNYMIDKKAKSVAEMLDDTKNYRYRVGAETIDDHLCIYGESFNYDSPTLSEYYQFEFKNGKYTFSFTHESVFLKRYLGKKNYTEVYGAVPNIHKEYYASLDEVHRIYNQEVEAYQKYIIGQRISHFLEFEKATKDLVDRLRKKELHIQSTDPLDIEDIIHIFGVEDKLDCTKNDIGCLIPQKASFELPDGITISIEDLYRAIELDIATVEAIHRIKATFGSLESVLTI